MHHNLNINQNITIMKNIVHTLIMALIVASTPLLLSAQHGQYVGGDISLLPSYERHNRPYLDGNDQPISDLITWLRDECGWNTFRIRIFVHPDPNFGLRHYPHKVSKTDPAICQDLNYVKHLGKRIKDAGCNFVLDFHYSDFWVDALKILPPDAWAGSSDEVMADSVATYTRMVLDELNAFGATPDMVQVGNEIMYGLCGIHVHPYADATDNWDGYLGLLIAGCNAVREKCPDAKIIIHTDKPAEASYNNFYYTKLVNGGVDFDIIGLSYYPFWHGYLSNFKAGLNSLKNNFPNKKVQIVETGYYHQHWPTSDINTNTQNIWPATPDGQYKFINDLITALKDYEQVEGLYYWFPEDAGNGDDTNWNTSINPQQIGTITNAWTNRGLWSPNQTSAGHQPIKKSNGDMAHYLFRAFLENGGTAIENPQTQQPKATKFLQNGQLLIRRGENTFTPTGQQLR